MCILFFILNENAKGNEYKLILASNRDEFYARPALVAGRWQEDESVIGGRDMEPGREGGTWLAISARDKTFKFGALLNITGESKHIDALPRGNLVNDYVKNNLTNAQYNQKLTNTHKKFNNFNLITIEISKNATRSMNYCNVDNSTHSWPQNEVLGFGNSFVQQPLQKVKAGKEKFRKVLKEHHQSKDELIQNLLKVLCDQEKHWPDEELTRRAPNWSHSLSSICVKMPKEGYGSRARTIILVDANNKVDFYEETLATVNPDGQWTRTHIQTEF